MVAEESSWQQQDEENIKGDRIVGAKIGDNNLVNSVTNIETPQNNVSNTILDHPGLSDAFLSQQNADKYTGQTNKTEEAVPERYVNFISTVKLKNFSGYYYFFL